MVERLSEKLSEEVAINVEGISEEQKEIIRYTVMQLTGELVKIIIMAAIAIYFNIGHLLLIAIFSMAIYRIPAGGCHSKSHISCFIASSVLFFGNVVVSILVRGSFLDYLYMGIFLINIPIIQIFAPADTEMKPIISSRLRSRLKIVSYITMTGLILVGRFLISDIIIRNIFIFGTLAQSITMLPFMYKMLGSKYGFRCGITEPQS